MDAAFIRARLVPTTRDEFLANCSDDSARAVIARVLLTHVCNVRIIRACASVGARAMAELALCAPSWFPIIAAWNLYKPTAQPHIISREIRGALMAGNYDVLSCAMSPEMVSRIARELCGGTQWDEIARDISALAEVAGVSMRIHAQCLACAAIALLDPRAIMGEVSINAPYRNSRMPITSATSLSKLTSALVYCASARFIARVANGARGQYIVNCARMRLNDISIETEAMTREIIDAPGYPLRCAYFSMEPLDTVGYDGALLRADTRFTSAANPRAIAHYVGRDERDARAMVALDRIARTLGVPRTNGIPRVMRARANGDIYVEFDAPGAIGSGMIQGVSEILKHYGTRDDARINIVMLCVWRHIMGLEVSGSASADIIASADGSFLYSYAECPRTGSRSSGRVIANREVIKEYVAARDVVLERASQWTEQLVTWWNAEFNAAHSGALREYEPRCDLSMHYLSECVDRARKMCDAWDARVDTILNPRDAQHINTREDELGADCGDACDS